MKPEIEALTKIVRLISSQRPPGGALPSAMRRPDHGGGYYSDEDPRYLDRRPRDRRRPRFEDDLPAGAWRGGGPDSSEEEERYQRGQGRHMRDRRGYEDDGLDYASRGGGGRRDRGVSPVSPDHAHFLCPGTDPDVFSIILASSNGPPTRPLLNLSPLRRASTRLLLSAPTTPSRRNVPTWPHDPLCPTPPRSPL